MGVSTDGILFYGYHFTSDHDDNEALEVLSEDRWRKNEDVPVKVGVHCSPGEPMYFVYVAESYTENSRGYPEKVDFVATAGPRWAKMLNDFAEEHNLTSPSAKGENKWDDETSEIGWWLVSYWDT